MTDININGKPDPELERQRLESDRRKLIELRAFNRQLIPSDIEGLILLPLTPIATGFSAAALVAFAGFPPLGIGAIALLSVSGGAGLWMATRSNQPARVGLAVLTAFFLVGIIGGLNNDALKQGLESIGVRGTENSATHQ